MTFDINNIGDKIEELKKQKNQHNAGMKKLVKQYATKEAIIDGPDRGYTYTKWHDDAAKDVHDELHKQWYRIDKKINHLHEAKRHLIKAHKLIEGVGTVI